MKSAAVILLLLCATFVGGILLQRQVGVGNLPGMLRSLVSPQEKAGAPVFDFPYEVLAVGELPDPRAASYPECLVLIRLRDRQQPEIEFIAHLWAFRSRKETPVYFLRPGDVITAELVSWQEAAPEIQRTQVVGGLKSSFTTPQYFVPQWACARSLPLEGNAVLAQLIKDSSHYQLPEADGMIFPPVPAGFYQTTPLSPGIDHAESALTRILEFHQDLQQHGATLHLCPVPDRRGIYADVLSKGGHDPQADGIPHPPLNTLYAHLAEKGVSVIDTHQALLAARSDGELFMRADHHWTSLAAMRAAEAIAKTLERPPTPAPLNYTVDSSKTWTYSAPTYAQHPLIRGLGVELNNAPIPLFSVLPQDDAAAAVIEERSDHETDLLLLSASHGHFPGRVLLQPEPSAGLHAHLTAQLGEAVNLLYVTGNSHNLSRREFVRQELHLRSRHVVWVFMEKHLTERWDEIRIPPPVSR